MSESLKNQYKTAVQQDIADSAKGVMRRPNNVGHYQRLFQKNDGMPVFLKTKSDAFIYRNMMRLSVIGIGISAVAFGMMAAGKFKKQ
ncbi:cytochrome c oxidase subunit 7A2, mitochondrial-like [Rhopilema esculentum]|uniref:cytochrome c oxidase subunit 7A2, mitochondrial-like n=1 Tax=Rhopilema esculentum TaxID=499914 RepID=UPI0031E01FB2